jgi:hypothetical protein
MWVTGLAGLVLLVVLGAIDPSREVDGGASIVDFEVAGSRADARDILAEWGDDGHDAARLSLLLDYPYLVLYGIFWTLAVAAVRDMARARDWPRLAANGAVIVTFPLGAAVFDAIENAFLLLVLEDHGGATAPRVALVAALLKFVLLGAAVAYVLAGLVRRAVAGRAPAG